MKRASRLIPGLILAVSALVFCFRNVRLETGAEPVQGGHIGALKTASPAAVDDPLPESPATSGTPAVSALAASVPPAAPVVGPSQLSYYSPKLQLTVNVHMGPPAQELSIVGPPLPAPIVVASDVGTNVTCLSREGQRLWSVDTYPYDPKGVGCRAGLVYFPFKNEVRVHRAADGKLVKSIPFEKRLYMLHVRDDLLIVGYEHVDVVEVYRLSAGDEPPTKIFACPIKSEHARFADVLAGKLYVADTFGRRVFAVDMESGEMDFELPMYYPCDVKAVDRDTLLIAEEHGNRIVKYKISEGRSTIVYSCPLELYANLAYDPQAIEKHEALSTWAAGGEFPGIGCCSERVAGPDTLYSPNGVTPYGDNGCFIADTDNHRVVYLHNGRMTTRVYGFNNPVKVAVVQ